MPNYSNVLVEKNSPNERWATVFTLNYHLS
jgi:hypothetical protein